MKLIQLSSDARSFRTLNFHHSGISLILGDGEHVAGRQDGDSNGVGKTQSLRLIHHCLGAEKPTNALRSAAGDWWFHLDLKLGGREFRISRTGDGSKIVLNEKEIKLKTLREWLNEHGGFSSTEHSFRSLFPRFARRSQQDSSNPIALEKEQLHEALQRTLYLLNADDILAKRKVELKDRLDTLKAEIRLVKKSNILRDLLRAGQKPENRLKELTIEAMRLRSNLEDFEVSEDYRNIEQQANLLTAELRDISEKLALLNFELDGIKEAQIRKVDITKSDLISLYEGLEQIFKPEILKHFDQVEAFQSALTSNRMQRLIRDEIEISGEITKLSWLEKQKSTNRSKLLNHLTGKRAIDEYVSISMQIASLEEERNRLQSFVDLEREKAKELQLVKSAMVHQDELALRYAQSDPIDHLDEKYRAIVQQLYPDASAGITLKNNTGENKIRFNLDVSVQGQESDGIGNARVLCFDWLVFKHGRKHAMNVLWHDNRLFADLDPKPRASWFSMMNTEFRNDRRQYIATLNYENYQSMLPFLSQEERDSLADRVIMTLRGDKDSNRLMGINFLLIDEASQSTDS